MSIAAELQAGSEIAHASQMRKQELEVRLYKTTLYVSMQLHSSLTPPAQTRYYSYSFFENSVEVQSSCQPLSSFELLTYIYHLR